MNIKFFLVASSIIMTAHQLNASCFSQAAIAPASKAPCYREELKALAKASNKDISEAAKAHLARMDKSEQALTQNEQNKSENNNRLQTLNKNAHETTAQINQAKSAAERLAQEREAVTFSMDTACRDAGKFL